MDNKENTELALLLGPVWTTAVFSHCGSTMDEARELIAHHDRVAVCAYSQTSGRGRRGNTWNSPKGGFYATYGIRFLGSVDRCAGLSLAVGVSIIEELSLSSAGIGLKWPNDIVHIASHRKLGGILIELISNAQGHGVLVGIGINREPMADLPESISLKECVGEIAPFEEMAACLARAAEKAVVQCVDLGFTSCRDKWLMYCAHLGRQIAVQTGELEKEPGTVRGDFAGVDSTGALMIATTERKLVTLHSGHVLEW